MLALVIVLAVTNLLTAGAFVYVRLRPAPEPTPTDPAVRAAVDALARRGPVPVKDRQFVSIEILNPIELAATRGRVLGLAGSFAPGFTRRIVYDQTAKTLRQELAVRGVVADVHVHELHKLSMTTAERPPAEARTLLIEPGDYLDELDLPVDAPRDQPPV
ncbi:MAG TPA: hypothetical protein VKQ07_01435 [Jatrophihabitantaceae bacterium]|nr:hypothetical protein [Jatrophihabitantaceae bacterium]